jgi:endonuclease-8
MEGPSLFLAQEQLKPFKKKTVESVAGNTSLDVSRLPHLVVKDIFSWGKHLVFQFDDFAIRIHFMLFGTYEAQVEGTWVTGDYRKAKVPRLSFTFENGQINMYNCSVKFIESSAAKKEYDFTIDVMSRKWDKVKVCALVKQFPEAEIGDVLLDQNIFAGVGNIIRNEVLSLQKLAPQHRVKDIDNAKLRALVEETHAYAHQFYRWRKKFVLRKHYRIYQKGVCPYCGNKIIRAKTGSRQRWSYWCPLDQK